MSQNSNLFLSVGKHIKDEYGRAVGRIASFSVAPSGKFDGVYIEQGDGKFLKYSVEHLKFDGADVTLISKIKSSTNVFCDQIPLIWRKDQALRELVDKKKISNEFYQELHGNFDGALNQLKGEAQSLIDEIDQELGRCVEETRALHYALVNLEIEHEIGKIDKQSYETAFAMIQENLKRVNTEKSDLEQMKNKLSNILLGEKSKTKEPEKTKPKEEPAKVFTPVSSASDLPEPPVVVYVKEIGKTGI